MTTRFDHRRLSFLRKIVEKKTGNKQCWLPCLHGREPTFTRYNYLVCNVIMEFLQQWVKWNYVLCSVNRNNIWSWQNLGRILENEFIKVRVEKILKGCLDWIPSPSVKIQIMGGKVCWHHPAMFCFYTSSKLSRP